MESSQNVSFRRSPYIALALIETMMEDVACNSCSLALCNKYAPANQKLFSYYYLAHFIVGNGILLVYVACQCTKTRWLSVCTQLVTALGLIDLNIIKRKGCGGERVVGFFQSVKFGLQFSWCVSREGNGVILL